MEFKTPDSYDFNDKKVLLRVDINSDVVDGKVIDNERIKESAITIKELIKKNAKIVVIAHQGNPGKKDFISLEQHSKLLNKYVKIRYIPDVIGQESRSAIQEIKSGEAILLDNIRFVEDEISPNKNQPNRILAFFRNLFDYYINDAFSVCHRDHTSITGFPKIIKECCVGRSLEKELKALQKISIKDCLYILGGAKPEDNIKLLKGKKVLACGLFAQLCWISLGKDLGFQNEFLKKATLIKGDYDEFLKKLRSKLENVALPVDFAVSKDKNRVEYGIEEFPLHYEIQDIGEKAQKNYIEAIKNAPAVYMKGPAGKTSEKDYAQGTLEILKAISSCKGFTLIGGGHLSDAIVQSGIDKNKFGHISLSGGALLSYIAGEKLPGLVALGIEHN
jgi:phosphoglycerate kinase